MKLLKLIYRYSRITPRKRKKVDEFNIPYYEAWHDEIGKDKESKIGIPLPPIFLN